MIVIVEVKNEILGDSEFWRGDKDKIHEIRNVVARELAKQVAKDGIQRADGMWHVRAEEREMDSVKLSDSTRTLDGLRDMMESALGLHDYVHMHVEIPIALFIVEVAKRSEDKPEWFPRGKWATIQEIQTTIEEQLTRLNI